MLHLQHIRKKAKATFLESAFLLVGLHLCLICLDSFSMRAAVKGQLTAWLLAHCCTLLPGYSFIFMLVWTSQAEVPKHLCLQWERQIAFSVTLVSDVSLKMLGAGFFLDWYRKKRHVHGLLCQAMPLPFCFLLKSMLSKDTEPVTTSPSPRSCCSWMSITHKPTWPVAKGDGSYRPEIQCGASWERAFPVQAPLLWNLPPPNKAGTHYYAFCEFTQAFGLIIAAHLLWMLTLSIIHSFIHSCVMVLSVTLWDAHFKKK